MAPISPLQRTPRRCLAHGVLSTAWSPCYSSCLCLPANYRVLLTVSAWHRGSTSWCSLPRRLARYSFTGSPEVLEWYTFCQPLLALHDTV